MAYTIRQPSSTGLNPVVEFFIDGDDEDQTKLRDWRKLAKGDLTLGYETAVHEHEKDRPCVAACEAYVTVFREEYSHITQVLRNSTEAKC